MTVIEILTVPDCPNAPRARALVAREAPGADVREIVIEDTETAERERFPGSPFLRVDGRDLEPSDGPYVVACRVLDEAALARRLREALAAAGG